MEFDTTMVIDYIIPDSPSDFGAILLWIFSILIVILGIRLYLDYRKIPKKIEKTPQNIDTVEPMKKSKEESMQDIVDIRNKVDKIIEIKAE